MLMVWKAQEAMLGAVRFNGEPPCRPAPPCTAPIKARSSPVETDTRCATRARSPGGLRVDLNESIADVMVVHRRGVSLRAVQRAGLPGAVDQRGQAQRPASSHGSPDFVKALTRRTAAGAVAQIGNDCYAAGSTGSKRKRAQYYFRLQPSISAPTSRPVSGRPPELPMILYQPKSCNSMKVKSCGGVTEWVRSSLIAGSINWLGRAISSQ